MPKEPLYPHRPKKKGALFPHVPKGQVMAATEGEVKHFWVEKNVPYDTWAVVEIWRGGRTHSPFGTKEEAINREKEIWEGIYELKLVPSPQEKFPAQYEALEKLYPYGFIQYHDDGDLTIQQLVPKPGAKLPVAWHDLIRGPKYVVTTDGEVFSSHTGKEALKKVTGEELPLTIERLAATETDPKGRVTKYCCRICGECAPKELLEEGRFLDRISWLRSHYKEKHPGIWGHMGELPATIPYGTCYEDAWRYLIREEEGELVHGTVQTIGKRIGHAWVELPTGFIWEPESGEFMKKSYFYKRAQPEVHNRYTAEQAAIMAARTGNLGPWTTQEREKFLVPQTVAPEHRPLLDLVNEPLPKDGY